MNRPLTPTLSPDGGEGGVSPGEGGPFNPQPAIANRKSQIAFTLIELLVVISIMVVLAALLMPVVGSIMKKSYLQRAQSEMNQLESAIQSYHAKFGYYPPGSGFGTPTTNQLYYELSGTTTTNISNTTYYTTSDNSSTLPAKTINNFFGVSGFMNCSQGSGDDAVLAQNFLPSLKPGQIGAHTNGDNTVTYVIVTAVHSDSTYHPLLPGFTSLAGDVANPWRYVCPGVYNPNSYDLWIQIYTGGKTNLICNWFNQPKVNTSME